MTTYSDPILIKSRHQIVAVIPDGEDDLDQILGYAVLTSAGARLRHELTLDAAKVWLEQRIQEENIQPPVAHPPAKATRVRR